MSTMTQAPATLDDLYKVESKAELIGGRIVHLMPANRLHDRVAGNIYVSLRTYAANIGVGQAFTDNMGFALKPKLPNGRESFSPDAAYHAGPFPADEWTFVLGGPTFAVEVRSPEDYGPAAERAIADKRADYFAAGTRVVWDVDPKAEMVAVYRAGQARPDIFRRGQVADAALAAPGWQMPVDNVFA
jgi:Uma2 family endonuclease